MTLSQDIKSKYYDFLYNVDTKYSQIKKSELVKKMFKETVNAGEAIVSILGNTGIAGFKFHVPQSEQIKMESDITDHFMDNNSVLQDHIARKPVTITLNGLQGDFFYSVNRIEDTLALVTPTLSLVKQFLPKLRNATKQLYTKKTTAKYTYNEKTEKIKTQISANKQEFNAIDMFKIFQELYKLKSAQTRAFFFFEAMWKSKALFSVETSWKRYDNMCIQNLTPIRDKNADITEFNITFKQISRAQTKYEDLKNAAGRTRQQLMKKQNKGTDKGQKVETV